MHHAKLALALWLGIIPLPATAQGVDFCTEAWVVRNMIFDRLGHCFSSAVGQTLFDNSDCTGSGPTPPPDLAETVALIRDGETFVGCQINTAQPPSAAMWEVRNRFAQFIDLPAPDYIGGYACWGYRGPAFNLHAGTSPQSPVVGTAQTGQSVVTTYFGSPNGWVFGDIVTGPAGDVVTTGWFTGVDISGANCDQVAG